MEEDSVLENVLTLEAIFTAALAGIICCRGSFLVVKVDGA
jgi:hypothetical protein